MKYFYNDLTLDVPEDVYCPGEDSELLAKTIEGTQLRGKKTLEVGCGSGLLSIIMAKHGADVTAVDIDTSAVAATKENAVSNGVSINAYVSDLFSNADGRYDLIVFNPPYLPVEDGENDATYAGGATGRETIEKFIRSAKKHLNPNGAILLLISSLTGEKEVSKMLESSGFSFGIAAREKVPWEELIVIKISL